MYGKQISILIKKRKDLSEQMQTAAEWLFLTCDSQKQVQAINDGFDGALAYYDAEIEHLKKLNEIGVIA